MPRVLRRSKRTQSPVPCNGTENLEEMSPKKKHKSTDKKQSSSSRNCCDSESSSDEFERPSETLKSNSDVLLSKKAPSPEVDFSQIENNIFSGVSRLSESDESDFEEVPAATAAVEVAPVLTAASASSSESPVVSVAKEKAEKVKKRLSLWKLRQNGCSPAGKLNTEVKDEPTESQAGKRGARSDRLQQQKSSTSTASTEKPSTSGSKSKAKEHPKRKMKEDLSDAEEKRNVRDVPMKGSKRISSGKGSEEKKSIKSKSSSSSKGKESVSARAHSSHSSSSRSGVRKERKESQESSQSDESKAHALGTVDHMDIIQLLALGESLGAEAKSLQQMDSESGNETETEDWEEVDAADTTKHSFPKEGVQITVEMPELYRQRKKRKDLQACIQAEMKRNFNRVRREIQVLYHKVSLLGWLAHGIFVNRVLNSESLRGISLSLIPTEHCYKPSKFSKKNLRLFVDWFLNKMEFSEGNDFHETVKKTSLLSDLEIQFGRKVARSRKYLVFMFVAALRALDIDCRLVISLQPMSLKPQSGDLLSMGSKGRGRGRGKGKDESEVKIKEEKDDKADKKNSPSKPVALATLKHNIKKEEATPIEEVKKEKVNENKKSVKVEKAGVPVHKGGKTDDRGPTTSKSTTSPHPRSPSKERKLRSRTSRKSYKEEPEPGTESEADSKACPILSPKRNATLSAEEKERLQAAAAKRLPANRRRSVPMRAAAGKKGKQSKAKQASQTSTPSASNKSKDSDDSDFEPKAKRSSLGKSEEKKRINPSPSKKNNDSDDSDFEPKPKRPSPSKSDGKKKNPVKHKSKGARVLSSDDDKKHLKKSKVGIDFWVEVYLENEASWITVDVSQSQVDCVDKILARATQPVAYVIAFNSNGTLKDVTKRYSPQYSQVTVKQRVSVEWWEKTMKPYRPGKSPREIEEDAEMNLVELDRPMPKSVAECKNHPLYVLRRHLLKFEAIYPPDAPTLGIVKTEPVYARQNVYTLHSREIWIKEAKVVRLGEKPYKIVKARPKYDRLSGKVLTDLPCELFGPWQVEDYVPPPAVNGKIPRNGFGNVELFKPTMLPKGCVHLQVPGLTRVAKKLGVDCAPAVVGFDYHSGGSHPTFDGFVVCEEHVDALMDAWNRDIDESAKRRQEKHEKRVYGNWRRLIKGLMIREHLKFRYDFNGEENEDGECSSSQASVNSETLRSARVSTGDAPLPTLFPKLMARMKPERKSSKMSAPKKAPNTKPQQKKGQKGRSRKKKDETSEEEESEWSSTSSEDESGMVLLSDEDSGSEFDGFEG